MLEIVIICKQRLVVVHVVCGTIVLNPNSFDSLDPSVECCFETECESTENCIVGRGGAIGICKICCIFALSISTYSASLPSTAVAGLSCVLGFSSLLCKVLFGDSFVTLLLLMISVSTVSAWREDIGLSTREDSWAAVWPRHICLYCVWIAINAESLVQTAGVKASCFFANTLFELCDRHLVDEDHLTLDPVAKNIDRERVGIKNDQFV